MSTQQQCATCRACRATCPFLSFSWFVLQVLRRSAGRLNRHDGKNKDRLSQIASNCHSSHIRSS